MRTPDFIATRGTPPTASTPATPAVAGLAWHPTQTPGGAFGQVFTQLHAEVSQVIDHGWPSDGGLPAIAMNPEAAYRRASLQAAGGHGGAGVDGTVDANGVDTANNAQQDFLASIDPWARQAGAALGVSPELVAAHAALESGWGQRPLRDAAGRDSHNLFGIKAQGRWDGARAEASTTEFEDGVAIGKTESFRNYPDYATAFRDYTRLLQDNPRYSGALNTGGNASAFAQALARGGYATDPNYAAKLTRLATQLKPRD